ncbi:MAG: tetratricopeptide repeat protein [Saprospirales bacterium]|nr:tetratricopeptide repeat protein [Saprospirales bacterium]
MGSASILRWILFLTFPILFFGYCRQDLAGDYKNLDPKVDYVGIQNCRSCHDEIYQTFIHTGMGRSFDRATPAKSDATYGPHALVYGGRADLYYFPYFQDSVLYIREFRVENGDTVHQRVEQVAYIVGSGQHTNSHILDINGYLYQAPVTFYTQEGKWDLAPGFRTGENLRFSRALNSECITCHNHFPTPVEGSLNKFSYMPAGIECERCHGPGEIHSRARLAGKNVDTSRMADLTIVNPRRLSRDLQMDICQRCHLQGVAVLNEGKTFYDFKPGMHLSEVMNVFLPRFTSSHERFIMASQADRLRLSPCYQQSEMSCITCHNPHQSVTLTDAAHYNNICLNCHGKPRENVCAAPMASRQEQGDNCVHCHMPPSGSIDIPHVNITDHNIRRDVIRGQTPAASSTDPATFLGLEILTKEAGTPLEMAEGYIALYEKYLQADYLLDSVNVLLDRSQAPPEKEFYTLVHYQFVRGDYNALTRLSLSIPNAFTMDPWTAYRLGEGVYQGGDYPSALRFYQQAAEGMPFNLEFQEKLGVAQVALKQWKEAEQTLRYVLTENPKRPMALNNLGFVLVMQKRFEEGEALYDQAIALDPDYEQALLNKAAVRLYRKDQLAARKLLERILKINPENIQARKLLE